MKIVITVKDTDNVIGLKEDIAMRLEGVADIVRIDTADVVPKSEAEATVEKLMRATDKVICETKAEVAREIFEEIEKFMNSLDGRYMASGNPKQSWGVRGAMAEIAELKKKYTEG